jgi:hypothetical protein
MVTDEKMINTALTRYRLGTIFIWLGVMTWLPFIVLRIAGEKPSLFWYLPVHLLGVVGGSRLRSTALKEMDALALKKNPLRAVGQGLIYIGVLVWAPYFYLRLIAQQPVEVMNFLPFHLAGVLGGVFCIALSYVFSRKE